MATEFEAPRRVSPWHPVAPDDSVVPAPSTTERLSSAIPELEDRVEPLFDTHGLTPGKPPVPSGEAHKGVPTPIEADAADLVPAVTMPDAAETFPTAPVTTEIDVVEAPQAEPADAIPTSPYLAPFTPVSGVRQGTRVVGDDASEAAAVKAAAAPPRALSASSLALLSVGELSALDDGEGAFVPRFESVPVDDAVLPESPLAHATIEASQDPAYTPEVAAPPSAATPIVVLSETDANPTDDDTTASSNPEDTMAETTQDDAVTEDPAPVTTTAVVEDPAPVTDADSGDGGAPLFPSAGGGDDDSGSKGSFWTSTTFLVIVGILVMIGIGAAVYALFFKPTDVTLPTETVVVAPAEPTLTPIAVTDASDFLAAMPTTVGAYALTQYTSEQAPEELSATEESPLPEGVAEQVVLTYSDGTDQVTVNAWQHYNVGGAQQTFEALNADGTDPQPVTVGGEEVGVQVNVASDAGPTVLWMNGTAVFSAVSTGDDVEDFVAGFGF